MPDACLSSLHPCHTLQWIAQFEITAVIVLLGLLSSLSLFGQYWDILTGATPYEDIQKPLLAEEDEAQGAEAGTLDVTGDGSTGGGGGGKAYRRVSTGGGVVAIATQPRSASNWYGRVEVMDEQERAAEHVLAQTVASPGNIILAPDPFHGGMPVVFRDPGECGSRAAYWLLRARASLRGYLEVVTSDSCSGLWVRCRQCLHEQQVLTRLRTRFV